MRLFLAHAPPAPVRGAVRRAADAWLADVPARCLRRVPESNLHLTLRFLGAVDEQRLARLVTELRRVAASCPAAGLEAVGPGAFPSWRRPAVLWTGVRDPSGRLAALARRLKGVCRAAGFDPERRPFRGHVTVARVRRRRDAPALVREAVGEAVREATDDTVVAGWRCEEFALFRSDHGGRGRRPGPSRYEVLESFPLSGCPPVG